MAGRACSGADCAALESGQPRQGAGDPAGAHELAGRIAHMVRCVAVAIRTGYPCDGVTVRQNNEPAGGQDVWHLHTHVIPRHIGDGMHLGVPVRADDRDRARYADRLRGLLG
ncbi:MAG: HIT family protein [Candidatus Latescibacteria bacterium]|nr:HIT family protein [Candidatus Latescibacterota bacterium]